MAHKVIIIKFNAHDILSLTSCNIVSFESIILYVIVVYVEGKLQNVVWSFSLQIFHIRCDIIPCFSYNKMWCVILCVLSLFRGPLDTFEKLVFSTACKDFSSFILVGTLPCSILFLVCWFLPRKKQEQYRGVSVSAVWACCCYVFVYCFKTILGCLQAELSGSYEVNICLSE